MPSCLALLLLMCLSLKMVGSQTEEPRSEDEPWLILSLKEGELPRISLQPLVQEVKRRKTGQFYPLMGKRARGKSLIQSVENKGGRSPVQLNKKAPKLSQPKEMAPLDKVGHLPLQVSPLCGLGR